MFAPRRFGSSRSRLAPRQESYVAFSNSGNPPPRPAGLLVARDELAPTLHRLTRRAQSAEQTQYAHPEHVKRSDQDPVPHQFLLSIVSDCMAACSRGPLYSTIALPCV